MRISRGGIAGTILMLLVAGICTRLGFWQLDRLQERRAYNAVAEAGMALPPLELDSAAIAAIEARPESFVQRKAIARGTFDYSTELLLRGRAFQGRPGVHVATMLNLDGTGSAVVVNRGWMPSPDAATADPRPFRRSGEIEITGRIQLLPETGEESLRSDVSVGDTTFATYQRLDRALLGATAGRPLLPIYLEAAEGSGPEGLIAVPEPVLGEGSHFGYAVQWFSFAAIAVVGFMIVLVRSRRGPSRPGS
jgi:surfeit locus 1 family protein